MCRSLALPILGNKRLRSANCPDRRTVSAAVSLRASRHIQTVLKQTPMAGLTAHLQLLAASWPLDVSIPPWPRAAIGSATTVIPFAVWVTKKEVGRRLWSSGAVHKGRFFLRFPYWFLLVGAFIMLFSRELCDSLKMCVLLREGNENTET